MLGAAPRACPGAYGQRLRSVAMPTPTIRLPDHGAARRRGRQRPRPLDPQVPDLGHIHAPVRAEREAVAGEPHRLPPVLTGPKARRTDPAALAALCEGSEPVAVSPAGVLARLHQQPPGRTRTSAPTSAPAPRWGRRGSGIARSPHHDRATSHRQFRGSMWLVTSSPCTPVNCRSRAASSSSAPTGRRSRARSARPTRRRPCAPVRPRQPQDGILDRRGGRRPAARGGRSWPAAPGRGGGHSASSAWPSWGPGSSSTPIWRSSPAPSPPPSTPISAHSGHSRWSRDSACSCPSSRRPLGCCRCRTGRAACCGPRC